MLLQEQDYKKRAEQHYIYTNHIAKQKLLQNLYLVLV